MIPFLLIGRIVRSYGLKGDLLVKNFSGDLDAFKLSPYLFLSHKKDIKVAYRPIKISRHDTHHMLLSLHGIENRDKAEDLVGCKIFISRAVLPELPDGEYYWHDLMGLAVISTDGKELGKIEEIMETGANDVYVARGEFGEALIPAIEDVIKEVNLEKGYMIVDLPPGLLD